MKKVKFKATVEGEIKLHDLNRSDCKEYIRDRVLEELYSRFKLIEDAFNANISISIKENE